MTRKSFAGRYLAVAAAVAAYAAAPARADASSALDEALQSLNAKAWTGRSLTHRDLDRLETLFRQAVPGTSADTAQANPSRTPGRAQPGASRSATQRTTQQRSGTAAPVPEGQKS